MEAPTQIPESLCVLFCFFLIIAVQILLCVKIDNICIIMQHRNQADSFLCILDLVDLFVRFSGPFCAF